MNVIADGEYSIEEVPLPGACGLAPVVVIGEETFGSSTRSTWRRSSSRGLKGRVSEKRVNI